VAGAETISPETLALLKSIKAKSSK